MLKIDVKELGIYFVNCYLIREEQSKSCCVIDPGGNANKVLAYLEENGLTLEAILLTHGHFDHVGAVRQLAAETGCAVYICEEDLSMPPMMTAGPLYYTKTYGEGTKLNLAGLEIYVIHTPGHTPGSVCLMVDNALFSGDTLFAGSCGRTDLPGGDWLTILNSLRRLASFETNYWVYPGHGPSSTLTMGKKHNPYLK